MVVADPLETTRVALQSAIHRLADVVRGADDLERPIAGSVWTARAAATHLLCSFGLYRELLAGAASPAATFGDIAALNAALIADVGEREPMKLARLLEDDAEAFLASTAGHRPDQPILFHGGVLRDLEHLLGIALGEVTLHGYDIATTVGAPWPIDPDVARRILVAYAPNLALVVDAERTSGLVAAFGLDIDGLGRFRAAFGADGFSFGPWNDAPVDAEIAADPVAFLLVIVRRLDPFAAVALGMDIGGRRPDLGMSFFNLLAMP